MSIKGQGHSLTLVKGHSDFKVKCMTFGSYNQVSDSGSQGPLVFKGILNARSQIYKSSRGGGGTGGGGDHTSWIKPPSLSASVPANFLATSGRRPSKPPLGAAGKYDEVGIPVEKNRKPPSLPAPILANFPARSGRRASQSLFQQ